MIIRDRKCFICGTATPYSCEVTEEHGGKAVNDGEMGEPLWWEFHTLPMCESCHAKENIKDLIDMKFEKLRSSKNEP